MSEKEKQLAENILGIFEQLPTDKKHQLLGVAQGMEIATPPVMPEKPEEPKRKLRKRRKKAG